MMRKFERKAAISLQSDGRSSVSDICFGAMAGGQTKAATRRASKRRASRTQLRGARSLRDVFYRALVHYVQARRLSWLEPLNSSHRPVSGVL